MRYSARPSTAEGHYYRLLCSNITIPRCCTGLRNSHRRSSSSRYAGMSPANCMRRTGPPTLIRERGYTRSFAGRCGRRYALPVDQRLKLVSDLDVQLCDTFVELALAAILGADRQINVFLRVAENRDQLGLGIDHYGRCSRRCWRIVSATKSPAEPRAIKPCDRWTATYSARHSKFGHL